MAKDSNHLGSLKQRVQDLNLCLFKRTIHFRMHENPIRIQCLQPYQTLSGKVPKVRKILFISIAINRITLRMESKMSDQDAIATSPYQENGTLDRQPGVRCQTDKKLPDQGLNQRDHSNDNAAQHMKNLHNTQQETAYLEKISDRQSHSLQDLTSAIKL